MLKPSAGRTKISSVSKYLERIADHATNIAEMVDLHGEGQEHPAHEGTAAVSLIYEQPKSKNSRGRR